jgi:hypothetical protein
LGKYLNVKLITKIIRAGASHTGGAERVTRDPEFEVLGSKLQKP